MSSMPHDPANAFAPSKTEVERRRFAKAQVLRARTGAPILDCLRALEECRTEDRAVDWLRARTLIR